MHNDLQFELNDHGDFVRLEPKKFLWPAAELDWDKNWIETLVSVKAEPFSGTYDAQFMTVDFVKFKQQLTGLYANPKGTALFEGLERQLEIKITGDGLGHFDAVVIAKENSATSAELTFSIFFDQSILQQLIAQLDLITKQFPIIGNSFKNLY